MMDTESVKQAIKKLIDKYDRIVAENKVLQYNEEMTKKDFILPLFRALGWNTENSIEVTAEEKISKKRVDYGFRINGVPKFFLEAKPLKADLDKAEYVFQAVNYAWHKGCVWAVLTDFESVIILNAEWKTSHPRQNRLKTIPCQEFLDRFEELWLLSKESFEQGSIDKEAEKWGKKTKKISVDKQLLEDFKRFRELLSKNITKLNRSKNLTEEDLDESVQRILDRLIFIRNCEDREMEAKTLIACCREWESRGKGRLIKSIREVFAYFDQQYNSEIFVNHLCDSLDIDNEVLHEIIEGLHFTKDQSAFYDFSAIEGDVLGNIYEQYLSYILKKTAKRARLTTNNAHRKEQGIYYTPTYIVNYIVRNTLGELLKNKKIRPEKIRVLDPACGSGSFLIKAFDVLNEHFSSSDKNYNQSEFDYKTAIPFTTKAKILQNNIFGVDLDPKAVEIARLNLLLKITERGQRLPLLKQNIKCGNSLIDDPEIAGYKALKWEEDFKEIMGEGGFDVVISNPPWVSIKGKHKSIDLSNEELTYFYQKYQFNRYMPNIYELFIWRGLSLLKEGGFLSFIVTDRLCANRQFINLRKYIIENFSLNKLWFKVPFPAVIADTVIFVIEKQKRKNNIVEVTDYRNSFAANIPQKIFQDSPDHTFFYICKEIYDIFERIKLSNDTSPLDKIVLTTSGCGAKSSEITEQKINDSQIRILKGESISRYRIYKDFWFEFDKKNLSGRTRDERKLGKIFKVLLRKTGANLIAAFDDSKRYPEQSLYFAYTEKDNDKDTLKYILAILNSKLMNCYYGNFAITNRDSTPQLKNVDLNTFPIKQIPKSQQRPIISLVDKMLSLNQRLNQIGGKKTDERGRIEEEIQKTDDEIDQLVYKIYGITEKEKKIIEKS